MWQKDQVVKICMVISERSIGLFTIILKLLANRIRAPTPTEPRLQQLLTLVKKLLRRQFLEADRLISESPDVISCQIMFQVFWLGYAIWELILHQRHLPLLIQLPRQGRSRAVQDLEENIYQSKPRMYCLNRTKQFLVFTVS